MTLKPINVVAFDLDGTLLNSNKKVSIKDYNSLVELGSKGILRVAATGRNLYSLKKILPENFPMDYAVFSSGAGVINWKTGEILKSWHITKQNLDHVINTVKQFRLNFTIHLPIPNNHHILIYDKFDNSLDLKNYVHHYKDFSSLLDLNKIPNEATQLIVLLNSHSHLYQEISNQIHGLKTILTTSPIDNTSMWMEVFHESVSKANGLKWLQEHLNIKQAVTFAIGNDYNDTDLLNYSDYSYIVSNAPKTLKEMYINTESNNKNALSEALKNHLISN